MQELYEKMAEVLIAGKMEEVKSLTQEALDKGAAARDVLDKGLLAGMDVVGQRFKAGDMFIPEVLLCARCMHAAMDILNPLLSEGDAAGVGTYLIGTVEGDLHDIGKNLVSMMLEGAGFQVVDLGTNITAQQFVDAVKEVKIMAGGAPVTQDFVDKIGGDAYGANAASATEKAKELVS
jgi:5-methyltetrahydrofolate--homocysteine methyltransferase